MTKTAVTCLLATYNGASWVDEQLKCILEQSGAGVKILASDDSSDDGTNIKLEEVAKIEPRLLLLPKTAKLGSAGKNFYRLILEADLTDCDYVAFSDQDDIWNNDKLIKQVELIKKHNADGVSSNVMAFWSNGRQKLINKAQPQIKFDYLFESAGPGCTFLMTPRLIKEVRALLLDEANEAKNVALHDWLCYAVCRAKGYKWVIDSEPTVQYRQHETNVLGANAGFRAKLSRLRKLRSSWYRGEVTKVAQVCYGLNQNKELADIIGALESKGFKSRLKLLSIIPQARRKFADRCWLALAVLAGLF